ncbi:MAG: hypothetical protein M1816_006931 [Peltula sp. TS41687]|nr:MAG: hypothetical protein M1816_006931 [Peltula sp. TS41687]
MGVWVGRQRPEQGPEDGQICAGVQMAVVAQGGPEPLMVQGKSTGGVSMHRPEVPVLPTRVQVEPVGQLVGRPGTTVHGDRGGCVKMQAPPHLLIPVHRNPIGHESHCAPGAHTSPPTKQGSVGRLGGVVGLGGWGRPKFAASWAKAAPRRRLSERRVVGRRRGVIVLIVVVGWCEE